MTLDSCGLPLRCETIQRAALASADRIMMPAYLSVCVCVRDTERVLFQRSPTLRSQDIQMSKNQLDFLIFVCRWSTDTFGCYSGQPPDSGLSSFWGAHLGLQSSSTCQLRHSSHSSDASRSFLNPALLTSSSGCLTSPVHGLNFAFCLSRIPNMPDLFAVTSSVAHRFKESHREPNDILFTHPQRLNCWLLLLLFCIFFPRALTYHNESVETAKIRASKSSLLRTGHCVAAGFLSVMATERKCFMLPGFSIPSGDTHHTHQMASNGVPKPWEWSRWIPSGTGTSTFSFFC